MEIHFMPQPAPEAKQSPGSGAATDFVALNDARARVVRDPVSISTTGTLRSLQYLEKEIQASLSRLFMEEVFGSKSQHISTSDLVTQDEGESPEF
ncbi:MAG: hypothetical protein HQL63_09145 [Magnetococcales bacterium]|nr:hypothetical protein [Magnetococcales bacterium]MBF0322082.1 hypothetical protein [Magnetococcales bacterium]